MQHLTDVRSSVKPAVHKNQLARKTQSTYDASAFASSQPQGPGGKATHKASDIDVMDSIEVCRRHYAT